MREQVTGVVLAGGRSSRFGSNKALAQWGGGETLVARACSILTGLFDRVVVVTRSPQELRFLEHDGVRVSGDLFADVHRVGGICSALQHARTERVFVCGCDMPLLQPKLVRAMWQEALGCYDAVVPVWREQLQPLCSFYSRDCIGVLRTMAQESRLECRELFTIVRTRFFREVEIGEADPEGLSFLDLDTPEDFARARKLL